jgi:hypothetical protein
MWPVGKGATLSNSRDGIHVVDTAKLGLGGLEGFTLGIPIRDVHRDRPYHFVIFTFIQFFG